MDTEEDVTLNVPQVVVATYSGKVVSFTSEPVQQRAQDDTYGRSVATVNNENRIKHLKKEIETLRAKVISAVIGVEALM